ncbi:MAG: hypothetical protein JEZ04_15925 [Spirochaetales bacterium]|nr:hypothetical protein [Spirochaetales bacterium]
MKQIIISLFAAAVLLTAGCTTVSDTQDADGKNKGNSAVEGKVQEKKTVYVANVVRETSFFNDGYIKSYTSYSYDEDMNIVREDMFDSFDQILESAVYEYSESGIESRLLYNNRGALQSSKKTIRTAEGQPLSESSYDAEGTLQTVSSYEYDVDGKKIRWTVADGVGIILSETLYLYDGGLPVSIELNDAGGKMQELFSLEYKAGLLVRKNHLDADGKIISGIQYEYDGRNLISEKYLRPNGSTHRTVLFTNDERGNPVKEEFFDGNGDLKDWIERKYEYTTEEILVWE